MKIACIIPARYASTRLPGKPLADIAGKPMIQRVYERVAQAKVPTDVIVATDDQRVFEVVKSFGGQVVMTSPNHLNGTDRLAEVATAHPDLDVIINVQGDEPLIDPSLIDELGTLFLRDEAPVMATVGTVLSEAEYNEPSAVKVICNRRGNAMYFSRSLVPYPRNAFVVPPLKHIGIYAYTRDFLLQYANMTPTPAEQTESLEQLRVLENGYDIRVITTTARFIGVDTPADLAAVNEIYKEMNK